MLFYYLLTREPLITVYNTLKSKKNGDINEQSTAVTKFGRVPQCVKFVLGGARGPPSFMIKAK